MNVLLVEDDPHKADRITAFLADVRPDITITTARSYQTGLRKIMEEKFALILLDMSLPMYEVRAGESGFDAPSFAGEEILAEMHRKRITGSVVVITQFDTFPEGAGVTTLPELAQRLARRFPELFIRAIFYSPGESTWTKELLEVVGPPP